MADESVVKTPDSMNVTLSDSELSDYKLSEPEPSEQPEADKQADEAKEAAEAKAKEESEAKATAEAEAKKKEEEGEKDQGGKEKESAEAKAAAEKKATEEAEEEEDEDPVQIEVDGKKYSQSDVTDLIKGNMMKADYTQKTQEVGGLRTSIEPLIQFLDKLKASDAKEITEDIRKAVVDDMGEEVGKLFEKALDFKAEDFEHPDTAKVKKLQAKVDEARAKQAFEDAQETFITDMKGKGIKVSKKEAAEVGKFTLAYYIEHQAPLPMEDAYKLMKAEVWRTDATEAAKATAEAEKQAAAEKEKQGHESIPSKDKGASDFVTESKTSPDTTDVTMEEVKAGGHKFFNE